jgi:hypothetical protein
MRELRRAPVPLLVVAVAGVLAGYWTIRHWHLYGKAAYEVAFLILFVCIGVLSCWFSRR